MMNRLFSYVLGLAILFSSGAVFYILGKNLKFGDPMLFPLSFGLIAAMGLAYTVMHQEKYPTKVVSIVYVCEILLFIIYGRDGADVVLVNTLVWLIILGVIFTLLGPRLGKAITFILSPIQKYFHSIGLKLSIHVIAGIIGFVITCIFLKGI